MSSQSLDDLIARVAHNDRRAFSTLYDRTSAKLFGVCLRILNDHGDAEEALQETFVKVWNNAEKYRAGNWSAISWLAVIARNTSIDLIRKRRERTDAPHAAIEIIDEDANPEELTELSSDVARLLYCLEELGPPQNEIIRQAYFGGHTYNDLADRTETPLGTIKSWIRRGLQKLRACIEREPSEESTGA